MRKPVAVVSGIAIVALSVSLLTASAAQGTASRAAAAKPRQFNLKNATVNRRPIIGRSISSVTASYGRPSARRVVAKKSAKSWVRYGSARGYSLLVRFRYQGKRSWKAWGFVIEKRSMREQRLGLLLRLKPPAIQNKIASKYKSVFEQETGEYSEGTDRYQCLNGVCTGSFQSLNRKYTVVFGRHGQRSFIGVARYGQKSWAS